MNDEQHYRQATVLARLGWRDFFERQIEDNIREQTVPARVFAVHRDALVAHDGAQERRVHLGRKWSKSIGEERPTTGDWLLLEQNRQWIKRLLQRQTVLKRVAPGTQIGQQAEEQAIAANVDTIFITTPCNQEFSESRLERYLTVAAKAQIQAVIVVTKSDLSGAPGDYRARVEAITDVPVFVLNALDSDMTGDIMTQLEPGQTVAMIGSSGVGKSTLLNTLAGEQLQDTGEIREDDKRGRHTTSHRSIHLLANGAVILDTPGIRELALAHGQERLSEQFDDVESLIPQCRFSNCRHESEPGCAIRSAMELGQLDPRRFENYQKLLSEDARNTRRFDEDRLEKRRFRNRKNDARAAGKKRKHRTRI